MNFYEEAQVALSQEFGAPHLNYSPGANKDSRRTWMYGDYMLRIRRAYNRKEAFSVSVFYKGACILLQGFDKATETDTLWGVRMLCESVKSGELLKKVEK